MEVMLLIALVALIVFAVRTGQNKRAMVRVPARVSQPKVMRRRY
jgi:hypothetical protein